MKSRSSLYYWTLLLVSAFVIQSCTSTQEITEKKSPKQESPTEEQGVSPTFVQPSTLEETIQVFLADTIVVQEFKNLTTLLSVDEIIEDSLNQSLEISLNRYFSYIPLREENVANFYSRFRALLPSKYDSYQLTLTSMGEPLYELIPNAFRTDTSRWDRSRKPLPFDRPTPIVRRISKPYSINQGLINHPIALWHSHGWYYNHELDRWMWQRARLFGTVEDLYPMSIVVPYLIPMLENAGANVFVPRERDFQTNEVIVDNDGSTGKSIYTKTQGVKTSSRKAFSRGTPPYKDGENPFETGSAHYIEASNSGNERVEYIPEIPEEGEYAVYVSYLSDENNTENAHYTVHHKGGETSFLVNQKIGGSTWIYLGSFEFESGLNRKNGKVVLKKGERNDGGTLYADAVRFGGGMGIVERGGRTSGRPKFVEGARYWMQYAGFPKETVYNLNRNKDYNDDYQGRGEWVNYLKGAPYGPNLDRDAQGMGIPIDLSLAFHTDAGITQNEDVIGTLMIYSVEDADSARVFPDGVSRLANRDFADILQTQIVDDLRLTFDSLWTRRNLYNRQYSEAYRLNVPAALLELLSHQNMSDMKYGLDPRFKFQAARSIYKAMLKFIAHQYDYDYTVQPLPVTHLSVEIDAQGSFELQWKPTEDPLEPTSTPSGYVVYTQKGDAAFDNGTLVNKPTFTVKNPQKGVMYQFKVAAVNDGGESMPSEVVAAAWMGKGKVPVLVVNAFDRVSSPEVISEGNFKGFAHFKDRGVTHSKEVGYVGDQYLFDSSKAWETDDNPGHGASHSDYEGSVIRSNSFDFATIHGQAIMEAGYSFVSCSDEAIESNRIDILRYKYVDVIFGEEKGTPWPGNRSIHSDKLEFQVFSPALKRALSFYTQAGGNLFMSGAYLGTDLWNNQQRDTTGIALAEQVFNYTYAASQASKVGEVVRTRDGLAGFPEEFSFNTELKDTMYQVESPDAVKPSSKEGKTIVRYKENGFSAGVAFQGYYKTVVLGFPFETVENATTRAQIMKSILSFFDTLTP